MLSDYNGIKLEVNNKDSWKKSQNIRLSNTLLNNEWGKEEIPWEILKYFN